jgi:hypothetical protein
MKFKLIYFCPAGEMRKDISINLTSVISAKKGECVTEKPDEAKSVGRV